jgi:hypothetical protein
MSLIGGRRRKSRKAGSMLQRAALPGLLTLGLLSSPKKRHGTRKGMRRKTARRAYMKKRDSTRRR